MLLEKILEVIDKGYRVEFKSVKSPYSDHDMIRVRLVKDDYDACLHVSKHRRDVDDIDLILTSDLETLESIKENNNA